jgi:hypothetical protein
MRRRVIAFVDNTVAAWPLVAHAQGPAIGFHMVGDIFGVPRLI